MHNFKSNAESQKNPIHPAYLYYLQTPNENLQMYGVFFIT